MGGDRFETAQPEAYLFGENQDLNFLGSRPVPFPYPAPQAHEPTKTLKSLVNIRKDSLRFVKVVDDDVSSAGSNEQQQHSPLQQSPQQQQKRSSRQELTDPKDPLATKTSPGSGRKDKKRSNSDTVQPDARKRNSEAQDDSPPISTKYNIEFTFDSDVKCAITIYYFATEEISNKQAFYRPRDPLMNSETFHYKRGANQVFSQTTHVIDPSAFPEEEWQYNSDKDVIPVVIQCNVEEEDSIGHSHMTFAVAERSEHGYSLKPLKQKQMVDGLCYLLQEIYGIENKHNERPKDDDLEDNGSECVICLVEMRDTLILPCRHLCLCNCCADNLRYQANNCPICRSPFRALLQIRAMRKKMIPLASQLAPVPAPDPAPTDQSTPSDAVPVGYETVSLIEALNGPPSPTRPVSSRRASYNNLARRAEVTTPEGSPLPGHRRLRRNPSSGSTRSRHSIVSLKDTALPLDSDRLSNTPEVIMSDIEEPNKSPKAAARKNSTTRPLNGKSALNDAETREESKLETEHEDITVELLDETRKSPTSPAEAGLWSASPPPLSDGDDLSLSGLEPAGRPSVLPPGEEEEDDDRAHGDDDDGHDASGSSYSSTESTKGLLGPVAMGAGDATQTDNVLV